MESSVRGRARTREVYVALSLVGVVHPPQRTYTCTCMLPAGGSGCSLSGTDAWLCMSVTCHEDSVSSFGIRRARLTS